MAPSRHRRLGGAGQRGHAAADAGGPGGAGLAGVAGAVAHAGRPGRRQPGRGHPRLGQARLPAPGAAAARGGRGDRRAARRRRPRRRAPSCEALPGIGTYTARAVGLLRLRPARSRWWTPTCGGWSPGWCTAAPRPAPPAPTRPGRHRGPGAGRAGAGGALLRGGHGAGRAGLRRPARRGAAPARSATAAPGGWPAARRTTGRPGGCRSSPAPTGRCAAGCSTCCARRSEPVAAAELEPAWDDAVQRSRCLDSLLDRRPGRADRRRPLPAPPEVDHRPRARESRAQTPKRRARRRRSTAESDDKAAPTRAEWGGPRRSCGCYSAAGAAVPRRRSHPRRPRGQPAGCRAGRSAWPRRGR